MSRLSAFAVLLAVAGCASSGPSEPAEPLPEGSWRGTLREEGALARELPATLRIDADAIEMVVGAARVRSDRASFAGRRLQFRAPDFPVTRTQRRTLRCDLLRSGRGFAGSCQAGASRYRLAVVPFGVGR